jgi:hypothetical protein
MGVVGCALALSVAVGAGAGAQAEETGMAGMHDWVKVRGRTCFADHFHSGNGTGSTRAQAEKQAIRAWVDFTAWEYGSTWGRYALAASKKMKCERGSDWSCFVEARPCRSF